MGPAAKAMRPNSIRWSSAQHYRYLLREVIAIRDGSRGNSNAEMVKVVKPYTPAEIEAVSDYMSQMAPPKP